MFLASRHVNYKRLPFSPTNISGLAVHASQGSKFKASVGDRLIGAECIEVFYYGNAEGSIFEFLDESLGTSLGLKVSTDYPESYFELIISETEESPAFVLDATTPIGNMCFIHLTINFAENIVQLEVDDVPLIYVDVTNGICFQGMYEQRHKDFNFPDWTKSTGDLIIYKRSLDLKQAEKVEYYLKNKRRILQ